MIYDISPPLDLRTPVWPGDVPLSRQVALDVERGDPVTLSSLTATVHLGAHADAPSHFRRGGASIGEVPLDRYLGPCQVITVAAKPGSLILPEALPGVIQAPRVLLRTGTNPPAASGLFSTSFAGLSPALVASLAARGVILIGVDSPSVDPFDSKDLPAHHACDVANIAILEGLRLDWVPDGPYELIALPLRLLGFDASPVRAVLRAREEPK